MAEQNVEKCKEPVWSARRYYPQSCGRPVKEDGLCSIHLRAKRNREKREVEIKQQRIARNENEEKARDIAAQLSDLVPIYFEPDWNEDGIYMIVEDPQALLDYLKNLKEAARG